MRHRVYGKHLGRDKDERDNLFRGLVRSLFTYGTIETSQAKAKAVKGLIDQIITLAKTKNRQQRLESFLTDKGLRERLVKEITPKLTGRNSGYTSLVRLGRRAGDQTMMVRMSLIGAEQLKPLEKGTGSRVQGTVKKTKEIKKEISEKKIAKVTSRSSKNKK